ncbi:hypothetical protein [Desulfopila aestuarii]|uniref:Uncharacterized protein n=1 Tax=Desulfopila aestuarii DSM 18488 TaxID=1121416 RepID=A0A1M7YJT8_9BACT|nr:hypothetical protein [Desulfopila aestuarii]SHO52836.1 hypothetical protein SAMN02745220_04794 [Desulfopila aestuarii DSM 18488]
MTAPTENELKFFHCEERSALATNGGRISTTEIISGAINNVWPHVLRAQRENGDTLFRKVALKIHQDGNGSLASAEFVIDGPTLGGDRIVMFGATPTDTQADIVDGNGARLSSIRFFCAGGLVNAVTAGASIITFAVKDAGDADGIEVGDDIRLTDKLTPSSLSGNVEYHTVATKSVSGLNITVTTVDPVANDYAAFSAGSGGKVGVVYSAGQVAASNGTITRSSAAGTFDDGSYPLTFNNMGADEHEISILHAGSGNFTATSDRFGTLAAGMIGANYAPLHPTWSKPLVTIEPGFWGGTWANGDTLTIPLHAAATFIWEQRDVPAGCAPLSNNKVILVNRSEGI